MNRETGNLLILTEDSINAYLDGLEFALDLLSRKLTELGYPEVSLYCSEIISTCRCFRYSRGERSEGIDKRLRIDPENSGFPNNVEFLRLLGEKIRADRSLKEIPPYKELAGSALEKIFRGVFPREVHGLAIRRAYYESVLKAPIARKFEIAAVREEKGDGVRRTYSIDWKGLDESKNLFLYYSLILEQEKKVKALHRCGSEHKLYRFLEEKFGHGPRLVFLGVEDMANLHPVRVWRWVLGPYYTSITRNPEPIEELFNTVEKPFIIRFRREEVRREGTVRLRGSGGKGKKADRDLVSALVSDEYLVAPFAIRQDLSSLFSQEDRAFTVFGATEDGELVF